MAQVKVNLSDDAFDQLFRVAAEERRPIDMQAEWLLMQALGWRGGGDDNGGRRVRQLRQVNSGAA